MSRAFEIHAGDATTLAGITPDIAPLAPDALNGHAPTAHYCLVRDNHLIARCSIWTTGTPQLDGVPVGVIGHYAATADAGTAVLNHASAELARRGFRTLVGPMDGNTWRRYRLLTERGTEPIFFMEPDNPDTWPGDFTAAGFTPLAHYFSALNEDLSVIDPRGPKAMARLEESGVRIRAIDMANLERELKSVHELSVEAFADNFLYTPISQEEFLAMYAPLRAHLIPELVLLAEQENRLIGFIFGIPDLNQAKRGGRIDTAIAKSMAVRPGRTGAGLGSILLDRIQQAAHQLGFTRVIHALMHENNRSMKLSSRFGRPFRQYTLYAKRVGP